MDLNLDWDREGLYRLSEVDPARAGCEGWRTNAPSSREEISSHASAKLVGREPSTRFTFEAVELSSPRKGEGTDLVPAKRHGNQPAHALSEIHELVSCASEKRRDMARHLD